MQNNDSPYVYEKPINRDRSRRFSGIAALGLVGVVGIFGGSAIASNVFTPTTTNSDPVVLDAETTAPDSAAALVDPMIGSSEISLIDPAVTSSVIETDDDMDQIIAVPLQSAKPKPNSTSIELPALTATDWGNTSSATPTSGSYGGSAAGSTGNATNYFTSKASEHDDDSHEREEDDHEDNDKDENHNESDED